MQSQIILGQHEDCGNASRLGLPAELRPRHIKSQMLVGAWLSRAFLRFQETRKERRRLRSADMKDGHSSRPHRFCFFTCALQPRPWSTTFILPNRNSE